MCAPHEKWSNAQTPVRWEEEKQSWEQRKQYEGMKSMSIYKNANQCTLFTQVFANWSKPLCFLIAASKVNWCLAPFLRRLNKERPTWKWQISILPLSAVWLLMPKAHQEWRELCVLSWSRKTLNCVSAMEPTCPWARWMGSLHIICSTRSYWPSLLEALGLDNRRILRAACDKRNDIVTVVDLLTDQKGYK